MVPFTLVFTSRAISHLPSFPLSTTMASSRTSTTGPVAWYVLLPAHAKDDTSNTAMHTTIRFMAALLLMTQKRHPKPMTPYKSMSKRGCDRIGPQECPTPGHLHPLHGAVCYDHGHLFAPVCHDPVSRDARYLEK